MVKKNTIWLTYGSSRKSSAFGWNVWVCSAVISEPHPWAGREIYRFALSRNAHRGPYVDKNRRGRKIEAHFFLSHDEALSAAQEEAKHRG